jgi:hypothetical protein
MRYAWKRDKATEVVTDFIDHFDPNNKPRRWLDWQRKPLGAYIELKRVRG